MPLSTCLYAASAMDPERVDAVVDWLLRCLAALLVLSR